MRIGSIKWIDSIGVIVFSTLSAAESRRKGLLFLQLDFYLLRNKRARVRPTHDDFADDSAADVRKFGLRNQENRLDAVADDVIELGNGFFVVEIGGIAEAAQEVARADAFAVIGGEVFKIVNFHAGVFGENLAQPFEALVEREKVFFDGIDADGDDDFVEQRQGTFHQINVAEGDGVKRAGKDCDFHSVWLKQGRSWGFLNIRPSNEAICTVFTIFY